jgi:hypothetical protein
MQYEEALIIGKRRRTDAAMALAGYVRERVTEVCAVKPSKDSGLDARDWEPVGEESFKEICIRTGLTGDKEAYLLVVDRDGTAKACTQRTYPLGAGAAWSPQALLSAQTPRAFPRSRFSSGTIHGFSISMANDRVRPS